MRRCLTSRSWRGLRIGVRWMKASRMTAIGWLLLLLGASGCGRSRDVMPVSTASAPQVPASPFLVKPYLQWGDSPDWQSGSGILVVWHDYDVEAGWSLEYHTGAKEWQMAGPPTVRRIAVKGVDPHRVYQASLKGLAPGAEFTYRLRGAENSSSRPAAMLRSRATSPTASWSSATVESIRESSEPSPLRRIRLIPISS